MNVIKNIIMNFTFNNNKNLLGRWSIIYCEKKLNKIIDLSNEDHCGPCGNHKLHNIDNRKQFKENNLKN